MLYVTTRNKRDAYTVQRALQENRGPDGGMYVPFHAPALSEKELAGKNFASAAAGVLNALLRCTLTAWDIEFAAGRNPVTIRQLRHRIAIAELWRAPGETYSDLESRLGALLRPEKAAGWTRIAIRTAVIFGVYAELHQVGVQEADLCMTAGDFTGPMSAWYARAWGLHVGTIVCVCNENKGLWSLLNHGQLRTDAVSIPTCVPQADMVVPPELERLIYEAGGPEEANRFAEACRRGSLYCPDDGTLERLRQGMSVSVVSASRTDSTIPSVYATHSCLLSPEGALAYGGLLDYRAKTGRNGWAVVLEDRSPMADASAVARAMDIPEQELKRL